jgi:hypothetical protein
MHPHYLDSDGAWADQSAYYPDLIEEEDQSSEEAQAIA